MADVFLSYAHEDKTAVQELAGVLEKRGFSCWWDRDIHVGEDFSQTIEAALSEARVVLVLWSEHSVSSSWVQAEASDALDRGVLIPVSISDVRVPLPYRGTETANLIGWPSTEDRRQLQKLIAAIDAKLDADVPLPPVAADHDPTLSVRVAKRVVDSLAADIADAAVVAKLNAQLLLERSITDICTRLLLGHSLHDVFPDLVRVLGQLWNVSHIGIWRGTELVLSEGEVSLQIVGSVSSGGEKLVARTDAILTEENRMMLKAYGLNWAYMKHQSAITIVFASSRAAVPDSIDRATQLSKILIGSLEQT